VAVRELAEEWTDNVKDTTRAIAEVEHTESDYVIGSMNGHRARQEYCARKMLELLKPT